MMVARTIVDAAFWPGQAGQVFHDLRPAGLKLADDRQGVGLRAGQGEQVADQVRVHCPDAAAEPGDLSQRGGRVRQAHGCQQLLEPGPG